MAASLASVTGGVLMHVFGTPAVGIAAGLPTLVLGIVWGLVLRMRSTVGKTKLRWGWLASIPLAMANGGLACGLFAASDAPSALELLRNLAIGFVLGASFGAIVWVPALLATLAFFGWPLARAQQLADRGLAGDERGEGGVGVASALLATGGLLAAIDPPEPFIDTMSTTLGGPALYMLASLGLTTGVAAALLALVREVRRRRFVAQASAGELAGFRIDELPEGKVLVRITSVGEGYRVSDVEEELLALDEAGAAVTELRGGVANPGRMR